YIVDIAYEMQRKGLLGFFMNAWQQYGDLARIQIRSEVMFLVTHPDDVRTVNVTKRKNYDKLQSYDVVRELLLGDGLLTSTGDLWRRQRQLMAPFFTPKAVTDYYPVILADGQTLIERWDRLAASGETVEIIDEMMLATASIILRSMFSMESDARMLQIKDAVETMIAFVSTREMIPLSPPLWLPTPANNRYRRARELVHTYIEGLIAHRRAMPEDAWPDDLLSKLMLARDEETGQAMPDDLLRDEAITIFFAGHETTARTLTFLWYALSQNPEVEKHLHEEIDAVIGRSLPTLDDLKQLDYTLRVIKETLRLYPPAPIYVRDTIADDEISGRPIPAGARMMLFPYATHRHPDFWTEPERFDPDRWRPDQEAARHPYAYHPFAAGQRICIGNNFSLFESQVLVAMLAGRYALRMLPGHQPQIGMAGTLVSRNGLPMTINGR
ncbi:MAG TPA: cytochrome P450, partial [Anaerolineae bacterium]|nr:cytochrome P450 [Anaerolineae bacterium]